MAKSSRSKKAAPAATPSSDTPSASPPKAAKKAKGKAKSAESPAPVVAEEPSVAASAADQAAAAVVAAEVAVALVDPPAAAEPQFQAELEELRNQVHHLEFELELQQQQSQEWQAQADRYRHDLENELHQMARLQDELAESVRRAEARERELETLRAEYQSLETSVQVFQVGHQQLQEQHRLALGRLEEAEQQLGQLSELREANEAQAEQLSELQTQVEELDLLKEDLEETIVDRRRELKALRQSEAEARQYCDESRSLVEAAEARAAAAESECQRLKQAQELELARLEETIGRHRQREEELLAQVEEARNSVNREAVADAERRHLDAERRLAQVYEEMQKLRQEGTRSSEQERLERRCVLLENDLKAANQDLMSMERLRSRWDEEKQQLTEELQKLKAAPAISGGADEGELRQWKLRCEDLREAARTKQSEIERLRERVDVLLKAKEFEEKQRKEVESRLRTALRIQSRQQGY